MTCPWILSAACVVPDRADGQLDIHIFFGASKGLSTVEDLDCGQFIEILFHERGELAEMLAASFTGNLGQRPDVSLKPF